MNTRTLTGLFLLLGATMMVFPAMAQPPGGGMEGPFSFDPAQMQQRMLEMHKVMLGATDEEWVVLEPLVKNVSEAQRKTMFIGFGPFMGGPGGPGGRGGRGGRPGADANAAPGAAPGTAPGAAPGAAPGGRPGGGPGGGPGNPFGPEVTEVTELRQALENADTPPETVQAKLDAFRKMREKAQADLKQARDALREVVTLRQEAQLVLMGMLE